MSFSSTVLEQWGNGQFANFVLLYSKKLGRPHGLVISTFWFLKLTTIRICVCVCRNAFNPLIILWSSWENVAVMVGWARTETCSRGWLCEKFRNQKIENFSQCRFFEKYLLNFEHIIELGLWKLLKNPSKTNSNQIGKWNVFVVWRKIIKQN